VYGIIESSTYGWIKAKDAYEIFNHHFGLGGLSISVYTIVFGLLFLAGFLWRQASLQRRGRTPLVSLNVFQNRQFMAGTTVTMIVAMTQFGFIFILPVFLQGMLGKDAFHTGLSLLPFSLSVMIAGPLSGILVGKANVPPKVMIQLGLVISVLGALLLRHEFSDAATAVTIMPGQVLFAVGFGLAFSQLANLTLSAESLGTADTGTSQATSAPVTREITRIKNDAIIKGVRTGLIATIGVALVALALSTQLPWRSRQAEDIDKPLAKE